MKIVHISPNASFTEGWSYHENLLPKYQMLLGHEVCLIVINMSRPNQTLVEVPCDDFIAREGFRVIRRAIKKYRINTLTSALAKMDVYNLLTDLKPDYIHFHGMVSITINQVVKYKKLVNPNVIIVMDNHLDYNIGNFHVKTLKAFILRSFYRLLFRKNEKYISKVYGVTPWRKQYAIDVFGVPEEKSDVLIMGADDQLINLKDRNKIRKLIRDKYGINDNDYLIVTGGKIDLRKKIHLLMEACGELDGVKLIVFGNVLDDIGDVFNKLLNKYSNIIYAGWASSEDQCSLYFASDLVVFPGQHSVMWEQACAAKAPCLFARWEGMEHVNNGGNCSFIDNVSVDGIRKSILDLLWTESYFKMKDIANSEVTDIFLYSNIAKKALEDAKLVDGNFEKNPK